MYKTDWKTMELKTKHEIEKMRSAGRILADILMELGKNCEAGITTGYIDKLAFSLCEKHGSKPTFYGYRDYPSAVCISVNDEVIHGLPGKRILEQGDIVGIDMGVTKDGWTVDSAITVVIPPVSATAEKLTRVTLDSLYAGIRAAKSGEKLFSISAAVQNLIEQNGFSAVREFVGHGVGRHLHEEPSVPNFIPDKKSGFRNVKILPGMTLALEPMVNEGSPDVKIDKDNWTVRTLDGALSAHFEHTIAVTKDAVHVLTIRDDETIEEIIKF